jgi:MoxR-like ATPase
MMKASKALAALSGRDFVIPDDIRKVTGPVLNHRIITTPEREMEGVNPADVINAIIKGIEVPR